MTDRAWVPRRTGGRPGHNRGRQAPRDTVLARDTVRSTGEIPCAAQEKYCAQHRRKILCAAQEKYCAQHRRNTVRSTGEILCAAHEKHCAQHRRNTVRSTGEILCAAQEKYCARRRRSTKPSRALLESLDSAPGVLSESRRNGRAPGCVPPARFLLPRTASPLAAAVGSKTTNPSESYDLGPKNDW
jgi:hypothetical protein